MADSIHSIYTAAPLHHAWRTRRADDWRTSKHGQEQARKSGLSPHYKALMLFACRDCLSRSGTDVDTLIGLQYDTEGSSTLHALGDIHVHDTCGHWQLVVCTRVRPLTQVKCIKDVARSRGEWPRQHREFIP